MSDITFEALKLVVMVIALLVARYLVPWLKLQIDADKMVTVQGWVDTAVLMVQQLHSAESGEKRKALCVEFINQILTENHISITAEQLDALIEAAVKQMKIEEGRI